MKIKTRRIAQTVLDIKNQEFCCDQLKSAVERRLLWLNIDRGPRLEIAYDASIVRNARFPSIEIEYAQYCPYCGQEVTL